MNKFYFKLLPFFLVLLFTSCGGQAEKRESQNQKGDESFVTFIVNPKETNIEFFWKDEQGNFFGNFQKLKNYLERNGKRLRFAMNGGMYQEDQKPLGLFIQNGKTLAPLNTREAKGNFYLKPNGVFFISQDNRAAVVTTENFRDDGQVKFATQSGPMLLIKGEINSQFQQNSENLNIRNGVCVLDENRVVFVISRKAVNFYDFADYFKNLGCRDALYLDGFVSRMYLPEKNVEQLDGEFGVIIGIIE